MTPLIVSYYTLGTGYEKEAQNLIRSCKKLGLQTDIVGILSKGKWEENCAFKPKFLLKMLQKHKRPLVWVDADAVILKPPKLFESLSCDIAIYINDSLPIEDPSSLLSGTIYLNYTKEAEALLKAWDEECQKDKDMWDQAALKIALLQNGANLSFFTLPESYCSIYDKKNAIIFQSQASRLLKKVINKEIIPFWE